MHEALGQFSTATAQETSFVPESDIVSRAPGRVEQPAYQPSSYTGQTKRWPALIVVAFAHVVLLALLATMGVVHVTPPKRVPTVVNMIQLPDEPPPPLETKPQAERPAQSPIVAPAPQVVVPPPPSPVQTVAVIPPVQQVSVVPAPPSPTPAPASVPSLSAVKLISTVMPKYPMESRRKRETGTVVLSLVVGSSGSVEQISVSRSSGFERLDKAALEAVRKWRWSGPGKGTVPVPFELS